MNARQLVRDAADDLGLVTARVARETGTAVALYSPPEPASTTPATGRRSASPTAGSSPTRLAASPSTTCPTRPAGAKSAPAPKRPTTKTATAPRSTHPKTASDEPAGPGNGRLARPAPGGRRHHDRRCLACLPAWEEEDLQRRATTDAGRARRNTDDAARVRAELATPAGRAAHDEALRRRRTFTAVDDPQEEGATR